MKINKKIIIAGCVKDCGRFLYKSLLNIERIKSICSEVKVIIAYDKSSDGSLKILNDYYEANTKNTFLIINPKTLSPVRTVNIANARNSIMNLINKKFSDYDIMIMMDMDDVSALFPINLNTAYDFLVNKYDDWDSLSFNRKYGYYDIWALRYNPYYLNCWAFGPDSKRVVDIISKDITLKLSNLKANEYLSVESAFNGIAFYKLEYFKNCNYNGIHDCKLYESYKIAPALIQFHQMQINLVANYRYECEHVHFHHQSKQLKKDLKILVSPVDIFDNQ
jgi:hypothetical protein